MRKTVTFYLSITSRCAILACGDVEMTASILCPVDFSDESIAALRRAAVMATRSGARLAALHVADALLVHAAATEYHRDVVVRDSKRSLAQAVDELCRDLRTGSRDISVHVAVGDPATEICAFCARHDIDLIVMASHQVKGHHRLFSASTAECVVRGALAPVLVFPTHTNPRLSTVWVAFDVEDAPAPARVTPRS
jgi:nucleotide-binding universal stress UspA family protein